MTRTSRVIVDGLAFPEGPRWHDGRLWFSDVPAGTVLAMTPDGELETIVEVPATPSGLGWLPDGRLLVVSGGDRRLLRLEADGLVEHADLSALAPKATNDMVVDAEGRAYVGNWGFDFLAGEPPTGTVLVMVEPDGAARVVAEDLLFPNGTVITPDGRTLVIAETFGARLTAFDVADDGSLSGRRVFAQLQGGAVPDGITLDAEGAIWVASPTTNEVLRVHDGGEVAERVGFDRGAYACMLGGDERRTLFVCTSTALGTEALEARTGRIEAIEVDVPGAGLP